MITSDQQRLTLPYGGLIMTQTFAVGESAPARPVRPEEARIASNVVRNYD